MYDAQIFLFSRPDNDDDFIKSLKISHPQSETSRRQQLLGQLVTINNTMLITSQMAQETIQKSPCATFILSTHVKKEQIAAIPANRHVMLIGELISEESKAALENYHQLNQGTELPPPRHNLRDRSTIRPPRQILKEETAPSYSNKRKR